MNVEDKNKNTNINLESVDTKKIADFLQILIDTSALSRQKVTSSNVSERGLIDRIELHLIGNYLIKNIIEKCSDLSLAYEFKYLKKRYFLIIRTNAGDIYCNIGIQGKEDFSKINFNPSKAKNYFHIIEILKQIFGEWILEAKVYRLDLTVDYFISFSEFMQGFTVPHKQNNVEYHNKKAFTGIQIGSGDETIILYDKGLKERAKYDWSRAEIQLKSKAPPFRTLKEIPLKIDSLLTSKKISSMKVNNIDFVGDSENKKCIELQTLVNHSGYLVARKKLNSNKNFDRNYGKFISLIPFSLQPIDILKRDLPGFFSKEEAMSE